MTARYVVVIVPIDAEAIKPALEEAKDKGVPVILKARGANGVAGVDYVTGVMSDFVWEGNQAGKWIAAAAKKKGLQKVRVIEIQGVIERNRRARPWTGVPERRGRGR